MSQVAPPAGQAIPELSKKKRGLPRMQEMGLVVVVLLLAGFLWLASPNVVLTLLPKEVGGVLLPFRQVHENGFLRTKNIVDSVLVVMSWMAVMSIGQTIVIISGGIDISVGSIMGLSAMVTALLLLKLPADASPWVVIPLGIAIPLGVGLLCGIVNGSLVVGLNMHPLL